MPSIVRLNAERVTPSPNGADMNKAEQAVIEAAKKHVEAGRSPTTFAELARAVSELHMQEATHRLTEQTA